MGDTNSTLGKTLLVSVVVAGLTILIYQNNPPGGGQGGPSPVPSTSSSPVTTSSPGVVLLPEPGIEWSQEAGNKPLPSHEPTRGPIRSVRGSRNETVSSILKYTGTSCHVLPTSIGPASIQAFQIGQVTTTKSSLPTGEVGSYYDPLLPVTQMCQPGYYWIDTVIPKDATPGNYTVTSPPMALHVWNLILPDRPIKPLYISLGGYALILGHKLSTNSGADVEGALTSKYLAMMRAHRIEAYAEYTAVPHPKSDGTLDLDQYQGQGSYRELVLQGRIADPMFPTRDGSQAYLTALQATLVKEGLSSAWTYAWDEPQPSEMPALTALVTNVKQTVPAIQVMVTTLATPALTPFVNHFTPVMEYWTSTNNPAHSWIYGSCMSHACGGTPHLTGTPDMSSIEEASVHALVYPLIAQATGAEATIYYNSVEQYGHVGSGHDPWTDLYLFNANGDGTLFYPGRTGERGFTSDQPVSSVRIKNLRDGMNIAEYMSLVPRATWTPLLQDPTHWSTDYQAWERLRIAVGDSLGGS